MLALYDATTGQPVYYRVLPGNMTDARTLATTLKELDLKGFKPFQFLLDRGYIGFDALEMLVKRKLGFIMAAKTGDKQIKATIEALDIGDFCATENYIGKRQLYGMDCEYPLEVRVNGKLRETTPLRFCLFFDPELQGARKKEVAGFMYPNSESLKSHIKDQIPLFDEAIREFEPLPARGKQF